MREMLDRLLRECATCKTLLQCNVALIADGVLTDEQVEETLAYMLTIHVHHA
jgi:hypothetical protein